MTQTAVHSLFTFAV